MNRTLKLNITLIFILLMVRGFAAFCPAQVRDTTKGVSSERIYVIQVAASKIYLDPIALQQKLGISEKVQYFQKEDWFKYYFGSYKTENEATNALKGLNFEAFVTSILKPLVKDSSPSPVADSSGHKAADSAPPLVADTAKVVTDAIGNQSDSIPDISEGELRQLYNLKIRQADSAFNISKNLYLARQLYQDASIMGQDKHYPADQIVEIDKLLLQKQSQSILTRFPLRQILLVVFSVALVIAVAVFVFIRLRIKRRNAQLPDEDDETEKMFKDYFLQAAYSKPVDPFVTESDRDLETNIDTVMGEFELLAKKITDRSNVQLTLDEVNLCLNMPDESLRLEAELALMQLNADDPLSFLSRLHQPFTYWQQLNVYQRISKENFPVPDFSRWLGSSGETVVSFAIRMIRAFRQNDAFLELVPLLQHTNTLIREEAILTLGEMKNPEVPGLLRNRYSQEFKSGKILIIRAIGKISDDANVDFLKSILESGGELEAEAAIALAQTDSFGIKELKKEIDLTDKDYQSLALRILRSGIQARL